MSDRKQCAKMKMAELGLEYKQLPKKRCVEAWGGQLNLEGAGTRGGDRDQVIKCGDKIHKNGCNLKRFSSMGTDKERLCKD